MTEKYLNGAKRDYLFLFPAFLISIIPGAKAQTGIYPHSKVLEYDLDSYIENQETKVNFDYNTFLDNLNSYLEKPININTADYSELTQFGLLDQIQINSLLAYRKKRGPLIALYEMQAIPYFDFSTIRRILPFVIINRTLDQLNESFINILKKSQKKLLIRWSQGVEKARGFQSNNGQTPAFLGNPGKLYLRYIQSYNHRISFGCTMEKDPGEEFFKGSNKKGFDFVSAHFQYKNPTKKIKRLVLGDFTARFGQGLILNTGFTNGKGALVTNIRKVAPILNRFTSVSEQNYFRGFGTTLTLSKRLRLSGFISHRKRDAQAISASDPERSASNFFSLQFSGLHRTRQEIAAKNQLRMAGAGMSIQYGKGNGKIALNVLFTKFDKPIGKSPRQYNKFSYKGQTFLNASIDYNYQYKNLFFFGETGWSDNFSLATVNGLVAYLHPKVALAIHSRYIPRNFHSLLGQTFSETTEVNNENGWYMGLEIRPANQWRFSVYTDHWKHPWLRFQSDAPSGGRAYLARITFLQRKKMEVYLQWKQEKKQKGYKTNYSRLDELLYASKNNFRFHINKKISPRLELRSRLEWSFFNIENSADPKGLIWFEDQFQNQLAIRAKGFLIYQDLIFKPALFPISATCRFALFDIDNYYARIYAFENDVTYQFAIPAYYNRGSRSYINLKYRAGTHLSLETRYARTFWINRQQFSSGYNQIDGQIKSEVKVQIRWQF